MTNQYLVTACTWLILQPNSNFAAFARASRCSSTRIANFRPAWIFRLSQNCTRTLLLRYIWRHVFALKKGLFAKINTSVYDPDYLSGHKTMVRIEFADKGICIMYHRILLARFSLDLLPEICITEGFCSARSCDCSNATTMLAIFVKSNMWAE